MATTAGQDQAAKAYRLLHAVFATAEADDLVRSNPCRIKGAGQEHHDERPLAKTDLVLDLADTIDARYRALVLVVGFGCLRTGEALGLRRCDVDLFHRELNVRVQAQELRGGRKLLDYKKTDAGRRTVALPAVVAEALAEHLTAYAAPAVDESVFTGPNGRPVLRREISEAWKAAKKATGAPATLRLYDLRHHGATLTARKPGVTTKELMGPRRALVVEGGAHLPARRGRARPRGRRLHGRRDRARRATQEGTRHRPRGRHAWGWCGVGRRRPQAATQQKSA